MSNSIISNLPPPSRPVQAGLASSRPSAPEVSLQSAAAPQVARSADFEVSRRELKQAVERLNEQAQKDGRNLAFSLDEQADRFVIRVKNSNTGELVRQIPDETVLRIAHTLEELKGLLYDETT